MKKIMIVLGIVVGATLANAAQFHWKAAGLYGYDGSSFASGTVATIYTTLGEDATPTALATATILENGKINTNFYIATQKEVDDNNLTGAITIVDSVASSYDFYFQYEDDGYVYTYSLNNPISQGPVSAGAAPVDFLDQTLYTQNTANWTKSGAVPEPTSGLLLLLGMAGLALKRKRV